MPKILGNSSCKNNKSCRVFLQESSKIGFLFFQIFCDFLRNLQVSAKGQTLFKKPTFTQARGTFQYFTDMPSVYTTLPEKKEGDAIGSPSHGGGGSGQNPAAPAAGSAGEGAEHD
jgi:hypothetical protein